MVCTDYLSKPDIPNPQSPARCPQSSRKKKKKKKCLHPLRTAEYKHMTDLNTSDGRLVLTELEQLLLHVAEDDGAWRGTNSHGLAACAQHVLMLPL